MGTELEAPLNLARLWQLAKPQWPSLLVGTIFLAIASVSTLSIPYFIGVVIDTILETPEASAQAELRRVSINLAIIFLVGTASTAVRAYLFTMAGEKIVVQLRKQLFESIINQEIAFFDSSRTGALINRISNDTATVKNAATVNVSQVIRNIITVVLGVAVMFYTSWQLSLLIVVLAPVMGIGAVMFGRFLQRVTRTESAALAEASGDAGEAFANIHTVRSFAQEQREVNKYWHAVDEAFLVGRKRILLYATFLGGVFLAANVGTIALLWIGGNQVLSGILSLGELTQFLLFAGIVTGGLGTVAALYGDFKAAAGASARVFQLIDRVPAMNSRGGERPEGKVQGHVLFDDVHFHFPARPAYPVLQGLKLRLEPGQKVALVGESGAGKTTVGYLLQRFYDPVKGRVLLDGRDLATLDPLWLRSQVGVVSQDPSMFNDTLRNNITYGLGEGAYTEAQLQSALELSNCNKFIDQFPDGLETVVGERGIRLSGGQRQRVAIARAILGDPPLLLLDEATSALDSGSEKVVQDALDKVQVGRTVLVIAHRLSTVKNSSKVCVIADGHVVEEGDHASLLAQGGKYRRLVQLQLQSARDELESQPAEPAVKEEMEVEPTVEAEAAAVEETPE